jgi:nitrite reductase (NO-forming)
MRHDLRLSTGALIVDPADLRPVAKQFVLVGSELFFGAQGGVGDYAKMLVDKPDAVVFNGYPFAYQRAPLTARVGDRVRVWVIDAGPTRSLAFHLVGAPFDTVYVDGAYTLRPGDAAEGGAQTLSVDPGDGGFVELSFTEAGSYPFLTHAMADAAVGAAGTIDVSK